MGIRCAEHVTPLYPQKLALTSPTGGGRSVGIVRSRTKATELYLFFGNRKNLDEVSLKNGVSRKCFYVGREDLSSCSLQYVLFTKYHEDEIINCGMGRTGSANETDQNCISEHLIETGHLEYLG